MSNCKIQTSINIDKDFLLRKLRDASNEARSRMESYQAQGDYETARAIERNIITAEDILKGDCRNRIEDIVSQTKILMEL